MCHICEKGDGSVVIECKGVATPSLLDGSPTKITIEVTKNFQNA